MRKIFLLLTLVLFVTGLYAQKIEKFLDYKGKECAADTARIYAVIEPSDSGWLRHDYYIFERKLQMRGLYKDSACKIKNGFFYYLYPNSFIELRGQYVNNKKQGLWVGFHPNRFMKDSTFYDDDNEKGISLHWYNTGYLSDSIDYKPDASAVKVSWFEDGAIAAAGPLNLSNLNHGKWQYFHHNGQLSAIEIYDNGRLVDKKYFAEDGSPMTDTTDKSQPAIFPGGIPAWTKYLGGKLFWPANYQITHGEMPAVGVDFVVGEDGFVKNVNINTPFQPAFNNIVLRIIKHSPRWIPAVSHNRLVAYHQIQFVRFGQKL